MGLINYSIRNSLVVNLSMVLIIIMGIISWSLLPQEMFPVFDLDQVQITTEFEGASPEEVEGQVSLVIENEFDGMSDIDVITSTSREGFSEVRIKLKPESDIDSFLRDARTTLDRITDLPDVAESPELKRLKTRFPVITVTLFGDSSRAYLFDLADDIKSQLLQIPGVASVGAAGVRDWELWVEVDPGIIAARKISVETIIRAIQLNLVDQPGGSIKSLEGDILLRGKGASPEPDEIGEIILRTNDSGGSLRLGDVADITRRFEEDKTLARFRGKPSVNLTVTKTSDASSIDISDQVHDLVGKLKAELPQSVDIGLHTDTSTYLKTRLNTVKSSGLIGLLLVILSLYWFLNFRVAAITAAGIPVAFLFAVILMVLFGHTINMVSLFAFLISLGMIVDDAIIVTENIYRHLEMGESPAKASELGAKEVFWPVIASIATTIAAFSPMLAVTGLMGEFIKVIPFVVCATLIGSLWEAFTVLPAHAGQFLRVSSTTQKKNDGWKKWQQFYRKLITLSIHHKYIVLLLCLASLLISFKYTTTRLPYEQFGDVETGQFFVNIEAPVTYSLQDSNELASQIEEAILAVIDEKELNSLLTNVGLSFTDFNSLDYGSQLIQVIIDLEPKKPSGFIENWISPIVSLNFKNTASRERDTEEVIAVVRSTIEKISGVKRFSILRTEAGPAGKDIEIGIFGKRAEKLDSISGELVDMLKGMPGVYDVKQDLDEGKLEYQYHLNERGRQLGITQGQIASLVRTGYLGREVVHVTWNEKRIPVRVIFPEKMREDSRSLMNLPIVLEDGRVVYFNEVTDFRVGRGLTSIKRRDGQRLITVTADVNSDEITPLEVTKSIEDGFSERVKDVGAELLFLGQKREADESFDGMVTAGIIALTVIFFILAALFKSLLDPFIVMFIIPFGFIGVALGHGIFGYNLQFLSMIGFLALSGIVVNDSLILVDFINKLRARGVELEEAVIRAGEIRSRPIILTSVTTFLGVSPLIFFATGQTRFLAPMAVSLGFGLLLATVLILLALPSFYVIFHTLGDRLKLFFLRGKPEIS